MHVYIDLCIFGLASKIVINIMYMYYKATDVIKKGSGCIIFTTATAVQV